jgi:hypothetical protein
VNLEHASSVASMSKETATGIGGRTRRMGMCEQRCGRRTKNGRLPFSDSELPETDTAIHLRGCSSSRC